MSEIFNKIFDLTKNLFIDERIHDYRSSFLKNQELLAQVTFEMDRALVTFSIAALTAMAALNNKIFTPYSVLSIFTLTCFICVIVGVIFGYFFSREMLIDANKIISNNYKKSLTTSLNKGLEKVKFQKTTKFVNTISFVFFVVGMVLFILLMIFYISGIHV